MMFEGANQRHIPQLDNGEKMAYLYGSPNVQWLRVHILNLQGENL